MTLTWRWGLRGQTWGTNAVAFQCIRKLRQAGWMMKPSARWTDILSSTMPSWWYGPNKFGQNIFVEHTASKPKTLAWPLPSISTSWLGSFDWVAVRICIFNWDVPRCVPNLLYLLHSACKTFPGISPAPGVEATLHQVHKITSLDLKLRLTREKLDYVWHTRK